jgi:tetratricopeptide (TPR) repeat protein
LSTHISDIEKLIRQGRNLEALNLAEDRLKTSSDLRLSQLYAMAMSKSGAPQAAMEYLEPVYREHTEDPETAGILGGIYKELFKKDQNTKYALLSRDTYVKNFSTTRNYYTGINAATMSAIAGQAGRGREIANEIIGALQNDSSDFWELATLGEASLLTKNREKAIDYYVQARKFAGSDWGKINSVYNQLWLLNHYVAVPNEVLKVFSPPGVVAFVGHMIDHPSRTQPRFPASLETRVKEAIASAIKTMNAKIGYCSLACGSDILFAEAMTEAGGEVDVWLPFSKADFIETSLRFAGDHWIARFEKLVSQSHVTFITEESYEGYDDLFSFQSTVIFGSAVIRSSMNHTKPSLLTVLSETDLNRKEGGTRDTVSRWPYPDRHVNINPDDFFSQTGPTRSNPVPGTAARKTIDRPVLYVVCADLPTIPENDQKKIWTSVQEKMEALVLAPVTFEIRETLFASFNSIAGAIELSQIILELIEVYHRTPKLRISLYASPAFLEPGPDEDHRKLASHSRDRLMSLHSQIPPGTLYALARFASVLALDVNKYTMDYAGLIPDGPRQHEIYSVRINNR